MELTIKFILGIICTIAIGLITNYIYDKIKNHSSSANRKSGLEFEFKNQISNQGGQNGEIRT